MKTTPFTPYHIRNGARMAGFAGYDMPIEFTGINDEHTAVRARAGVFDVSHMGEIWVKGPRALDLLRYVGSNDAASLYDGKIQYSCLPNGRGGIVDDILVYRIDAETYLLVVNAANVEKDWNHLVAAGERFGLRPGRELYNASDEIAQLAVQGPLAMRIVQRLCPAADLGKLAYYTFVKTEVAGIADAIVSVTGYTGAGGCEIYRACGKRCGKPARETGCRISGSARATRCGSKWATAFTATTSTIRRRPSRPVWAGSRRPAATATSSTARCSNGRSARA